jgi:hypothetical protein
MNVVLVSRIAEFAITEVPMEFDTGERRLLCDAVRLEDKTEVFMLPCDYEVIYKASDFYLTSEEYGLGRKEINRQSVCDLMNEIATRF